MSSKWNTSESETVVPPGTYVPEPPHVAKTTSGSTTTSYPSVRLSTTDIGLPGESTTSGTTSSSADVHVGDPAVGADGTDLPGHLPDPRHQPAGSPHHPAGPRINETRTASP